MEVDIVLAILGGIAGATIGQLQGDQIKDWFRKSIPQSVQKLLPAVRTASDTSDESVF